MFNHYRVSVNRYTWNDFTLQKGYLFGEDKNGYFVFAGECRIFANKPHIRLFRGTVNDEFTPPKIEWVKEWEKVKPNTLSQKLYDYSVRVVMQKSIPDNKGTETPIHTLEQSGRIISPTLFNTGDNGFIPASDVLIENPALYSNVYASLAVCCPIPYKVDLRKSTKK